MRLAAIGPEAFLKTRLRKSTPTRLFEEWSADKQRRINIEDHIIEQFGRRILKRLKRLPNSRQNDCAERLDYWNADENEQIPLDSHAPPHGPPQKATQTRLPFGNTCHCNCGESGTEDLTKEYD
jgi:hypothetical protein